MKSFICSMHSSVTLILPRPFSFGYRLVDIGPENSYDEFTTPRFPPKSFPIASANSARDPSRHSDRNLNVAPSGLSAGTLISALPAYCPPSLPFARMSVNDTVSPLYA